MLDELKDAMKEEISSLKSVTVGAVMHTLHQMFKQAMSTLALYLENAKTKPGGPPSHSPAPHPASMSSAALNGESP